MVGNLTQKIDRNTHVIQYDYDRLDRLTTESWYGGVNSTSPEREIAFSYDLVGRLTYAGDADAEKYLIYGRPDLDSPIFEWSVLSGLAPSAGVELTYDLSGQLVSTHVNLDETPDNHQDYSYESARPST
ncbi:MAG: hypothetical protein IT425_09095 [Pirellulales bacterium]|nr:hypothetical protein [Pirellulales bacterium]